MRADALGLFWEDRPPEPKAKAEKVKRQPPEPVWLRPDYLPGLEEALAFPIGIMTDSEVVQASINRERMLFDIETYVNYFIASFRSLTTGKVRYFELYDGHPLDVNGLGYMLQAFTTVGFNSIAYDLPITQLAMAGKPCALLKRATEQIILEGWSPSMVYKQYKVKPYKFDHIDLIEVAPLRASLKIYGGRLHTPRMQDLPFHPDTVLTPEQRACVRWYNINADLTSTAFLHECLREHLDLRTTMSAEVGVDLRSKSDAQVAEAVIAEQYFRRTGRRATKPVIPEGTTYKYQVPHFLRYQTPLLNWALGVVAGADFVVDETGSIAMPEAIKALKLNINQSTYTMGIGGLHSTESCAAHHSDAQVLLKDIDVTSYYPFIILNLGLYPEHLGPVFLMIYRDIVDRRVAAKAAGNKVVADSLKITINGSFGKLGSKYSILYSPNLLIQVTLTGQLCLLMLIERLELAGIPVVSANTDGIVVKCPRNMQHIMDAVVSQWERDTGFATEGNFYKALYSRDVNNYIAVKEDGGTKTKGAYANPWASKKNLAERLHKNPTNIICIEAVSELLTKQVPLMTTIRACRDFTKFVSVRSVKGGAAKVWEAQEAPPHNSKQELIKLAGFERVTDDYWKWPNTPELAVHDLEEAYQLALKMLKVPQRVEFLGKSIRWYYATGVEGEIVYASNGNKVPRSDGAMPALDLPAEFPNNIDYEWYEAEAERILRDIGYTTQPA